MIRARGIIKTAINQTILKSHSFHTTAIINAASVFKMPAMSPTMTEGGIISWKFKPGETFNSGDVLLEVETDKATIDVEAVDDGKMFEILVNEGTKGVPVGKAIAFIAEQDDDLSTLTKPEVEEVATATSAPATPAAPKTETAKAEAPKKQETKPAAKTDKPASSSSVWQKANPNQKLSPAVELLLHEHNISSADAIANIPASGPNGRLLKGDVLAHLGSINADSIVKLTEFLKSKQHLDLSNIVLAQPEEKPKPAPTPVEKPKPKNILSVQLVCDLGKSEEAILPAKFKFAFEKSINSAIRQSYGSKFPQYISSPSANVLAQSSDLFDEIVAPAVTKKRFEVYDINYKFSQARAQPSRAIATDSFDELLGLAPAPAAVVKSSEGARQKVNVEFKIKYDEKLIDSKEFVEYFEDSLLTQIPTNSITITN